MIQILHNARCGKSRDCLTFLTKSGKEFEVINYLKSVPTYDELTAIISKLAIQPIDLIRKKELIWIENFKNQTLSDSELIKVMVANPIIIERPIVINGMKAIIARPIENVKSIL